MSPHPPQAKPVFGIAPFLAAAIAAAGAALILGPVSDRAGRVLALLAGAMALASFGPQKYLDPQFALIWPAVIAAQVCVVAVFYHLVRHAMVNAPRRTGAAGA
ncbi:MAG: hypothetical protein ACU0DK_07320 [Pseudooceanicola sp.]